MGKIILLDASSEKIFREPILNEDGPDERPARCSPMLYTLLCTFSGAAFPQVRTWLFDAAGDCEGLPCPRPQKTPLPAPLICFHPSSSSSAPRPTRRAGFSFSGYAVPFRCPGTGPLSPRSSSTAAAITPSAAAGPRALGLGLGLVHRDRPLHQ